MASIVVGVVDTVTVADSEVFAGMVIGVEDTSTAIATGVAASGTAIAIGTADTFITN